MTKTVVAQTYGTPEVLKLVDVDLPAPKSGEVLVDVKAIGLETAQGMVFTEAYYWDQTDATRAYAARFARIHGRPPTMFQASMWGAVTHYLKAVQAAGTDAAAPVVAKMRETTTEQIRRKAKVMPKLRLTLTSDTP